jgi:hypothetical protein
MKVKYATAITAEELELEVSKIISKEKGVVERFLPLVVVDAGYSRYLCQPIVFHLAPEEASG